MISSSEKAHWQLNKGFTLWYDTAWKGDDLMEDEEYMTGKLNLLTEFFIISFVWLAQSSHSSPKKQCQVSIFFPHHHISFLTHIVCHLFAQHLWQIFQCRGHLYLCCTSIQDFSEILFFILRCLLTVKQLLMSAKLSLKKSSDWYCQYYFTLFSQGCSIYAASCNEA